MAKYKHFLLLLFPLLVFGRCGAQQAKIASEPEKVSQIKTGASQWERYLPELKGKKVGVVSNQTSLVNEMHLVDFLISKGILVKTVFAPEHGFRGEAGPGDKVASGKDDKTGLPIISLYGKRRKPEQSDLNSLEYVIFDMQDVGVRFYTYISTLHYLMEACAENNIPVMVFDRPNPNGFYIDGPVLDTAYRSFVGIAPLPVVHGLTVGEYAMMANGEGWLKNTVKCNLQVIKMENYSHNLKYELPVRPSPNLPNMASVYLYPSLCFFEGAAVSIGRGTAIPFQVMGFPGFEKGAYAFTPVEIPGVIKDPPYEGQECKGILLSETWPEILETPQIKIEWLIDMYNAFPEKDKFFNNFFEKLAGTDKLRQQIIAGESADEIRKSWQPDLERYREMRLRYMLYPD